MIFVFVDAVTIWYIVTCKYVRQVCSYVTLENVILDVDMVLKKMRQRRA